MGRTVIAEEIVDHYISSLYGVKEWQLGLVVGQTSAQRDFIIHLAKTPEQVNDEKEETSNENGEKPRKKKAEKLSSLEEVDNNWVVEHARQRITCRTLDVADPKATLKPAELKYQSFISKWHRISCMLCVDTSFIVQQKHEKSKLHSQIMTGFKPTLQSVFKAIGAINGQLLPDDRPLAGDKQQGHTKKHQTQEIQNFKSGFISWRAPEFTSPEKKHSVADMKLCGVLSSRAYLHNKATVEDAIQAIKQDLARSLVSRSELLCEDIEVVEEEEEDEQPCSTWVCPKRIFAPVFNGSLCFCDYMFPEEQFQDSLERFSDLLDVRPKEEQLVSLEEIPDESDDLSGIIGDLQPKHKPSEAEPSEIQKTSPVKSYGLQIVGMVVGFVAVAAAGLSFLIDTENFL